MSHLPEPVVVLGRGISRLLKYPDQLHRFCKVQENAGPWLIYSLYSNILSCLNKVKMRIRAIIRLASCTDLNMKFPRPQMQLLPLVPLLTAQKLEHFCPIHRIESFAAFKMVLRASLGGSNSLASMGYH